MKDLIRSDQESFKIFWGFLKIYGIALVFFFNLNFKENKIWQRLSKKYMRKII